MLPVAGHAVDNLGAPEPLDLAGGGRNEILDSGPAVGSDVECKEKAFPGKRVLEASELAVVGLGATGNIVDEDGDEMNGKGGTLQQCTAVGTEVSTDTLFL